MAYVPLEVTLISAKDLANVNVFSKMEVYAVATISSSDTTSKKKTPVDREGSKNPTWNCELEFNVMEYDVERAVLHVVLKSERALGDRDIGEVIVPVCELLEGWNRAAAAGGGGCRGGLRVVVVVILIRRCRRRSLFARTLAKPKVSSTSPTNSENSPAVTRLPTSLTISPPASYTAASPPPAYPPHAGPPTLARRAHLLPTPLTGTGTLHHPAARPTHIWVLRPQQGGYGYTRQYYGYGYG
ncbi:uncharacterized protein A4U43_C02F20940 [Asparagus officinalis]|uniref:C2 domain-containing protein n=1 Tax=Asparagus officinalis TaxID=4686 RepID=A0A5P1FKK0_ASPOF|nr:uncharacterized protein A4U43_C02F20940 [Asparagus officinalis]